MTAVLYSAARAATLLIVVVGRADAQAVPTTIFSPRALPTGTSIEALFDVGSGTLQREINDRLYRTQAVRLEISWPVSRVAGTLSYFDQSSGGAGSLRRLSEAVEIPNAGFRDSSQRDTVCEWIRASGGEVDMDDIGAALLDGSITVLTAARVAFNRQSVWQLLQSGGAAVAYSLKYNAASEAEPALVPDSDVRWVFRSHPVSGPPDGTLHLVSVDVVAGPIQLNLVRSGEGLQVLTSVVAEADFIGTEEFRVVQGAKVRTALERPALAVGGGEERPLVVEMAQDGLDHLFREVERLEENGVVRTGVGIGVVASLRGETEQDSFSGINVSFPRLLDRVWDLASAVELGVTAGLNTRRDIFVGPSVTLGRVLTLAYGMRSRETGDGTVSSPAGVLALSLQGLLGSQPRTPIPVNVLANEKTFTRAAPDQNLLDAKIGGLFVEIVDTAGTIIPGLAIAAQPSGSEVIGTVVGVGMVLPVLPGSYKIEQLVRDADDTCIALSEAIPITVRAGEMQRVRVRVLEEHDDTIGVCQRGTTEWVRG